jgi:hypothetical protein
MRDINAEVIAFPQCGCALELTIGQVKSPESMHRFGCGVGISTDANGSSNVTDEIREAAEKVPAEITIKFIDRPENEDDGA